ncbi:MAG: hypothetical protein UW40_C0050G0003 [Parcubacteria group bacterium GW2011_GWF2_44_17]|nr:MAG: hypothetical protein UW40_C0050G0003 [Parcubacteria group bacterium GW2011_GWF2_44_17]
MRIEIKKFGTLLVSRQDGREAYLAQESVEIDFTGVTTFTPSWGDEFLTPIVKEFGKRVFFRNTKNPSVDLTIKMLDKISGGFPLA